MIDLYCERVDPEFWSEPFNALTNLAFVVAAYFAWRLARGTQMLNAPVWWLIALILAIGVGSFLFHTLATAQAMVADVTPILVFQLSYLWIYVGTVMQRGRAAQGMAVGGLVILLLLSAPLYRYASGSPVYLPALLALIALGIHHIRHANGGRPLLLAAAAVLALSMTARTLDPMVCSQFPIGTHFLWHLLNGVVLYLVMRGLLLELAGRRERIDFLIEKQKLSSLTDEEKSELRQLH